ncbi:MAG: hypothetical protein ACI4KR_02810 [Ruminiclostridium sp.]
MAVITGRVISRSSEIRDSKDIKPGEYSREYAPNPQPAVIPRVMQKQPEEVLPQKEESEPQKEIRFFTDPVRVRRDKLGAGAAVMLQLIISAGAALALWLCLTFGGEELREALCDVLRKFI